MIKRIMYLLLCIFLYAVNADAATYFMSTGGVGTACTSGAPCGTFDVAIPKMAAGDTLQLRGGTYNQRLQPTNYSSHPNGTDYGAGAVTVMSYPGETAILTQVVDFSWDSGLHHWILKNLTIDGTAVAQATGDSGAFWAGQGVHHIRLDNVTIQRQLGGWIGIAISGQASDQIEIINSRISGFEYGFYMRGTNWLVSNNEIYNNEGYGVHVYDSGSTIVSGNIISNNYVHDNGQSLAHGTLSAGIVISHGTDNRAINNVVTGQGVQGNCLAGIQVGNQSTNAKVYNNTITGNFGVGGVGCPGISINAGDPIGTEVKNNIIFNNTGGSVDAHGTSATYQTNLCASADLGCDVIGTPSFESAGAGNYKLNAGSPGVDQGTVLAAVPTDKDGVLRPQNGIYDIGAYERLSGGPPPPTHLVFTTQPSNAATNSAITPDVTLEFRTASETLATQATAAVTLALPSGVTETIPQSALSIFSVSSEELSYPGFQGFKAIDGDPGSYWHTAFTGTIPPHPHTIVIDLGSISNVVGITYLRRPDDSIGTINAYEIYVGDDGSTWGAPVGSGNFTETFSVQSKATTPKIGRYLMVKSLSDTTGSNYTTAAEITVQRAPTSGTGALTGTLTRNAVGGIVTFPGIAVTTPGTYMLQATSPGMPTIQSNTFTITGGAGTHMVVTVQPVNTPANAVFPDWTVEMWDVNNVLDASFGGPIAIAFGQNPTGALLTGSTSGSFYLGQATWCCNLRISKAGVGYTFIATSPGFTSVETAPFNVSGTSPGTVTNLRATPEP